jgi:hypothetical protein
MHSEQGHSGIDLFGHFAGLTAFLALAFMKSAPTVLCDAPESGMRANPKETLNVHSST